MTVEELTTTIARYLGEERTRTAFDTFAATHRISLEPKDEADFRLLRYAEHILASAIGGASSRLVLSLLLRKRTVSTKAALKLLDDANAAIQYNREILQTALDHVRQGIAVFDKELQLICWNRQFGEILDLPPSLIRSGIGLADILRFNCRARRIGRRTTSRVSCRRRLERYVASNEPFLERFAERGLVIEVRANRMPDGGIVTTFTDITPQRRSGRSARALERDVGAARARAHRGAHLAQRRARPRQGRGRRRQYLENKVSGGGEPRHPAAAQRGAALRHQSDRAPGRRATTDGWWTISMPRWRRSRKSSARCSTCRGSTPAPCVRNSSSFRIDDVMRQIELEFSPLAAAKGLELKYVPCSLVVRSDRRLLRRLVQNLVSNAIKYTPSGRVLIGCRRRGERLRIDVYDTGVGIPESQRRDIFVEFHRLEQGARIARGLGLGLSIVERIARVLGSAIELQSTAGGGSHFADPGADLARRASHAAGARRCLCRSRANSPAPWRYASTTSRRCSTAWRRCCAAGAAT